jgi:hypothetical protein
MSLTIPAGQLARLNYLERGPRRRPLGRISVLSDAFEAMTLVPSVSAKHSGYHCLLSIDSLLTILFSRLKSSSPNP